MKVLFLDVDGVLNTHRGGYLSLNKKRIKLLQMVVDKTDCKIVLSSTWRKSDYAMRKLKRHLGYRKMEIYSMTIVLNILRGYEIDEWLSKNRVEKYAIVDENDEMLKYQQPYFVLTNPNVGLTIHDVDKLIKILE